MNLEQYFALHVTDADAKVRWKTYQQYKSDLDLLLEQLQAYPDHQVTCATLREALVQVRRTQEAYTDAVAALITGVS